MNIRMLKLGLRPDIFAELLELKTAAKEKFAALQTTPLRKLAAEWAHNQFMSTRERHKIVKELSLADRGGKSEAVILDQLNGAANTLNEVIGLCSLAIGKAGKLFHGRQCNWSKLFVGTP